MSTRGIAYTAHLELARTPDDDQLPTDLIDDLYDTLGPFSPSFSVSPRGCAAVTMTIHGVNISGALAAAAAVTEDAFDRPVIAATIATETEAEARAAFVDVPDLVSVAEAAELLGVTPQAVRDRINRHTLQAVRIGERGTAVPRAALVDQAPAPVVLGTA